MSTPLVSVVMTAYNAQEFLNIAVDSLLLQTYRKFELIIVDDGSTDHTRFIIENYKDPRIKYFYQKNKGLAAALNLGISNAKGEYVARMDADDISFPERLSKQVKFMQANKKIALLGTNFEIIDENGCNKGTSIHLDRPEDIKLEFLVRNPFGHGTTMVRRAVLQKVGGYNEAEPIEDYELWWRIAKNYKIANLSERLYSWRVVRDGISHGGSAKRQQAIHKLVSNIWSESKVNLPATQIKSGIKHYTGIGPSHREQFIYMLAALIIASHKIGQKGLSAKLLTKTLMIPGIRTALVDMHRRPLSHNYILTTIYK